MSGGKRRSAEFRVNGETEMEDKLTMQGASDKAWEILSALKGDNGKDDPVDPSFTLYLTEIIMNRGTVAPAGLSREMVTDIVSAMMKHGVGMHDWPMILEQLVKALHMVILYNIPDVYQEKAVELAAQDLLKGFDATRAEYLTLMGTL
jgi:hypothetical protein